jgi:UDP-glucose 4-epimerase
MADAPAIVEFPHGIVIAGLPVHHRRMNLLITGGTGFAMSVLALEWLESNPEAHAIILDAAPLDAAAARYFAPVADRLEVIVADIRNPAAWQAALSAAKISHIVHGATITPISNASPLRRQEPEAVEPARIVDVNIMGTVAILEWARAHAPLERFIYVSSGAVYLNHGPNRPGEPLPEDGYVMPRRLYGISKLASELITERYGELFALSTASVRPASVYGPMDRVTASRNFAHMPKCVATMALDGARSVRVNTVDAIGDYINAEDLAHGIIALLKAPTLKFCAYNIASGVAATVGDLVRWAAEKVPGFHAEVVDAAEADIVRDASLSEGMWGAYDISRIRAETGWRPRPVREAFHAYMDWITATRAFNT